MAGQIVVSSIKTDSDNSISFLANTGATIFSANLASGLSASSFGDNTITSDKIVSVANTKISGVIEVSQLADTLNLAGKTVTLPAGTGGKVLQVVQATFTDIRETTTSTSFVDTSVTASITPSSTSNKVLVLITSQCSGGGSGGYVAFAIERNSTDVANGINYDGESNTWMPVAISYLDSPSSTSAVTYTLRFKSQTGSTVYNGWGSGAGGSTQNIVLMEIAG